MKKRRRFWTEKEDLYIEENYPEGDVDEIAAHLKRSRYSVQARASKIGVGLAEPYYAMYKGDDFETMGTAQEIADELGIHPETVKWYSMPTNLRRLVAKKSKSGRVAVRL